MKYNNLKVTGWMIAVLLLSVGFAHAQTNTLTFDNGGCGTQAACSKGTPIPNTSLVQIDGPRFLFYERTMLNGTEHTHMIIRDRGDASGGFFQQESFTKGNGFFVETNQSSIGAVTFRQFLNVPGNVQDITMDNLSLMARGPGIMVANQLSVMQNITDPLHGLVINRITMTPRNNTAPVSTDFGVFPDLLIHVDQTMTGVNGFNATVNFDVGQQITPRQTF
jgi:hypothetical protein